MKKTVNVNVGGFAFVIEETAYELLNMYLEAVRRNLGNDVDANEVMNDIEARIAELFRQALRETGKEVVENALIDRVISVMGKPEDYGDGTSKTGTQDESSQHEYTQRTLFRDSENKMLGGVCSGLASYFGWDPLAFRIIFVLLLFGFGAGVLVYIVLWILIPEAKTTADKLRMRGEPINVDTIKKRFNDFKNDVTELGSKANKHKLRANAHSIGSRIESIFRDFGKIISQVLGIGLLLAGITLLVFIIKFIATGTISIPQHAGEELFFRHHELFFDFPLEYYCFTIGIFTLTTIIMLGFISSGIDLLFGLRIKSKPVKYATVTFSFIAIGGIVYGGINMGKNYAYEKPVLTQYAIPMTDSVLNITVMKDEHFSNKMSSTHTDHDELIKITPSQIIFGYPSLAIRRSGTGKAYMEIERSASGPRELKAIENAEAIDYHAHTDTSHVYLPAVFTAPVQTRYRNQNVYITLYLPDHVTIQNLQHLQRILNPYNSSIVNKHEFVDEPYVMTSSGMMPMSKYLAWQGQLAEEKKLMLNNR